MGNRTTFIDADEALPAYLNHRFSRGIRPDDDLGYDGPLGPLSPRPVNNVRLQPSRKLTVVRCHCLPRDCQSRSLRPAGGAPRRGLSGLFTLPGSLQRSPVHRGPLGPSLGIRPIIQRLGLSHGARETSPPGRQGQRSCQLRHPPNAIPPACKMSATRISGVVSGILPTPMLTP